MEQRFRTIVADPPWPYESTGRHLADKSGGRNADGRGANVSSQQRYGVMSIEELAALLPPDEAEDNAHLYLWTTNAFMIEAHQIAEAWGFKQKTILTWTKTHQDDRSRVSMKTGYYFRGATEHCLFCVRGSLKLNEGVTLPTGFLWPRLRHSEKPDAFFDMVEQASPAPRLEMFARKARLGWQSWGDESLGTVSLSERAAAQGKAGTGAAVLAAIAKADREALDATEFKARVLAAFERLSQQRQA